jgi:cysteine desulfurase
VNRIYLDHNASTPVRPEILEAAFPFLKENFGNPSSVHWAGSAARVAVDEARERVAAFLGAEPEEIVFTGGGTESNNLAIKGMLPTGGAGRTHLVVTAVEHPSVLETALDLEERGISVTVVPVDGRGSLKPEAIGEAITPETVLVSAMFANNETGTILPIARIGEICRERGVPFHTDAVQAAGKVPIDLRALPVDMLSISGHKVNAFKGVGALYVRRGTSLGRQLAGGPHERRRRAGTENVPGIVSLGAAAMVAGRDLLPSADVYRKVRDHLWEEVARRIPDVHLNGHPVARLPNTLNVSFLGASGESVLMGLDLEGIAVSSGAACSTGSLHASNTLLAMGVDEESARSAIRFSLGWGNRSEDVEATLAVLPGVVERARRASSEKRASSPTGP